MAVAIQTRIACFREFVEADQFKNTHEPSKLQKFKYAMHAFAGRSRTTRPSVIPNYVQQDLGAVGKSLFSRSVELLKDVKTYLVDFVKTFLPDFMFSRSLNDILAHRRPVAKDGVKGSIPEKIVLSTTNDPELKHKDYPVRIDITDSNYNQNVQNFTHSSVMASPSWADLNDPNKVDYTADMRQSFCGFKRDSDGAPLNPLGRTGLAGRGLLGRWGANIAADPVILKWTENGELFLVTVVRKDRPNQEQKAFPGGFVNENESFLHAAARELAEEALRKSDNAFTCEEIQTLNEKIAHTDNSLTQEEKREKVYSMQIDLLVNKILNSDEFKNSKTIYKGVVDDPRNTDNAWVETVASTVEIQHNSELAKLACLQNLEAGDDAEKAEWTPVTHELVNNMYASHGEILLKSTVVQEYLKTLKAETPATA